MMLPTVCFLTAQKGPYAGKTKPVAKEREAKDELGTILCLHDFGVVILGLAATGHDGEETVPGDTVDPYFKNSPGKHCFA